jgi:hypothetical protein
MISFGGVSCGREAAGFFLTVVEAAGFFKILFFTLPARWLQAQRSAPHCPQKRHRLRAI